MQIDKAANGFSVQVPFSLKDMFRTSFPSAKWNSVEKRWHVGPRSLKRLEQWIAESKDAAEQLKVSEELPLRDDELRRLRSEIADTLKGIDSLEELRAEANESLQLIEQAKAELDRVREIARKERNELAAERTRIDDLLSGVIDMARMREVAKEMAHTMNPAISTQRRRFKELQEWVIEQRGKLAEAGLSCDAVDWLATANLNRPDRDNPKHMRATAWFSVEKLERDA